MQILLANPPTKPIGRRASRRKKRRFGVSFMARSKRRRSSRRRGGFVKATRKVRRRRNRLGTSTARIGFLNLPARPMDLVLGGAGSIAAAFALHWLLAKIPIAQIQSGYGNIIATGIGGAALGGVVAKFNRSVGLGIAIGSIASAGLRAIAMSRGGGQVQGFVDSSTMPLLSAAQVADLAGYASDEVAVQGYAA